MQTTETKCIRALQKAADRLDESPTKSQYEALGMTPASATIIRVVGGWNEAKERAGLTTNRSTGSRTAPKPDDVDLPDGITWEGLSVDQRWHYRNVEWNTKRTLQRRAKLRTWVNKRKHEQGCVRCGEDDPACLDYHHMDQTEKTMAVGTMITHGYGRDRLRHEISKCEVLCANCHRLEHHTLPTDERRRWAHEYKKASDGCARCSENEPPFLDFHHPGPKEETVARLLSDDRPMDRIRAEIAKCTLLCANCHRKEHHEPPAVDG